MNCKEAVAALVASIENADTLTPEIRQHLRTCPRCVELLDSAKQFDDALATAPLHEPRLDDTRLKAEVKQNGRRHHLRGAFWAMLIGILATSVLGTGVLLSGGKLILANIIIIAAASLVFGSLAGLFFYAIIAALHDGSGNRIHKRLKEGRLLSGVCLGLSEASGIAVIIFRLAFIALALVDGVGIWLYIVFDLAMPVHPDDRRHLLRFRIRRWWQRRFGHADQTAG